jgi:hypothetical protein
MKQEKLSRCHIAFFDAASMESSFSKVPEQDRQGSKETNPYRILDDDGYGKMGGEEAAANDSSGGCGQTNQDRVYGQRFLMEASMEAWAWRTMTPQEAFHQVERHHYSVESKRRGDLGQDSISKQDPAREDKLTNPQ